MTVEPELLGALRLASRRYWRTEPHYMFYAWFKYRLDPCYLAVASEIPPKTLTVDLGTGLGMLPVLLGLWGGERQALGIEHHRAKVRNAKRVTATVPGVQIDENDALTCAIPACDVITLVDVLHYYPPAVQRDLLARCARSLNNGGRLLVREGDQSHEGSARWTRWVEEQTQRFGWNKGPQVFFRPIEDIARDLVELGFSVSRKYVSGKLHPGNVLLIAEAA